MLYSLVSRVDSLLSFKTASAHCDIPCKVYDPYLAQYAALSVIRFMDLIAELDDSAPLSIADQAKLTRLVAEKEHHAQRAKNEIQVIWGDYFKQPQIEQFPEVHALAHSIMLAGSSCKQGIERDKGLNLLILINEFTSIFWATKNIETYTAVCPFLPQETVVYPVVK